MTVVSTSTSSSALGSHWSTNPKNTGYVVPFQVAVILTGTPTLRIVDETSESVAPVVTEV